MWGAGRWNSARSRVAISTRLEALATELADRYGTESVVVALYLIEATVVDELLERVADAGVHVDTLVNNAWVGIYGHYHESDAEPERSMLDLNVVTLTKLTKRVVPGMVEWRSCRILNVGSVVSVYPVPHAAVYAATKAYVLSYSVSLAEGLRPYGITVTALCPPLTRTDWVEQGGVERSRLASKKMATPEEVARAAARVRVGLGRPARGRPRRGGDVRPSG